VPFARALIWLIAWSMIPCDPSCSEGSLSSSVRMVSSWVRIWSIVVWACVIELEAAVTFAMAATTLFIWLCRRLSATNVPGSSLG